MEGEQLRQVDVRDAVAPCQHESAAAQIRPQPFDAAAGGRVGAGVDEMDGPVQVGVLVVKRNGAVARSYRQVPVKGMQIEKIADHRFFLVAERNGEFVHAIGVVVLHDVPDDRLAADLEHEFRHRDRSVTPRMNERIISERKEKKRTVYLAVKNKKMVYWLEKAV